MNKECISKVSLLKKSPLIPLWQRENRNDFVMNVFILMTSSVIIHNSSINLSGLAKTGKVCPWIFGYAPHDDIFIISHVDESLCGPGNRHAASQESFAVIPDS